MHTNETIVLVGTGNMATTLGHNLLAAGLPIAQVLARRPQQAAQLASNLGVAHAGPLSDLLPQATLVLLAVSDTAIPTVAQALGHTQALVAHTAGAVPLAALHGLSRSGVLYPWQSVSKGHFVSLAQVPILVEAAHPDDLQRLLRLAAQLSAVVLPAPSVQRAKLHLAAVFANNFSNHLWYIAQQLCLQAGLPTVYLEPLLRTTLDKYLLLGPLDAQTGPARRADTTVLNTHHELLADNELYQKIYTFVSRSIQETHHPAHNNPTNLG